MWHEYGRRVGEMCAELWWVDQKETDCLKDLDVGERIIL
jgi:hypothetical protein